MWVGWHLGRVWQDKGIFRSPSPGLVGWLAGFLLSVMGI